MSTEPWLAVDAALADLFVGPDPVLRAALLDSQEAGLPEIAVSANLGKLLYLLVKMAGARRVLEIGTLGGYSTIWLARALPTDGVCVSLELSPEHAAVARRNLERAGLEGRTEVRVGDAASELAALRAEGSEPFDFVFVDADKEGYPTYLEGAVALSRPGTVIVADNIVRGGAVFDEAETSPVLEGVRTFLHELSGHPHLESVALQMVGAKGYDGITVSRVAETPPGDA